MIVTHTFPVAVESGSNGLSDVLTHGGMPRFRRAVAVRRDKGMSTFALAQWRKHRRLMPRAASLGLLGLIAVLLSACVEVNQQSTIKPDFTGTTQMRVGISKQALLLVGGFASGLSTPGATGAKTTPAAQADPFADLATQVKQLGGTSKPYQNDKFQGLDTSFTFTSLDQMQTQINSILGSNSALNQTTGGASASSTSSDNSDILQITAKATANGVRIDGQVDPLSSLSDTSSSTTIPGLDPKAFGGTDGIVQLAFTMPGKSAAKTRSRRWISPPSRGVSRQATRPRRSLSSPIRAAARAATPSLLRQDRRRGHVRHDDGCGRQYRIDCDRSVRQ